MISPGGKGVRFYYFDPDSMLAEIIMVTHSVTLMHMSPTYVTPPKPIPDRSALIFSLLRNTTPGNTHELLPDLELLGLYMVFRVASRSALSYFTIWYKDRMSMWGMEILTQRKASREIQLRKERLGCRCMSCEADWLEQGWTCPWSRFAR